MNSVYDGYSPAAGGKWFAGANTEAGFSGSYAEIAGEGSLARLYIIKGGPGTGKSTLMRRVGEAAEAAGHTAEFILCGSDPASLDAVILDGRIAAVDGTAPHTLDMVYPGAASELIDLSAFWDTGILSAARDEIVALASFKAAEFASAYRWLAAAGKILGEEASLARHTYLAEKAEGFAARLVKRLGKPEGHGIVRRWYTHGITMLGRRRTDGISDGASVRYTIEDCGGCARLFLPVLADALTRAGWDITLGMLPLSGIIGGIRAGRFAFVCGGEDGDAAIRMSRFTRSDPAVRGELRLAAKLRESCLREADERLRLASESHFKMEEIYRGAMDFGAKERYEKRLIVSILDAL
ncbi:MAG: hypothetical protein K6A33_12110 [Clostridiales bacterium]|nr:hypothetical protein [Clostridiales bacterium]